MLLHACGGCRRFQAVLGGSGLQGGLQGAPGASGASAEGLQKPNAPRRSTAKASNLGEAEISRGMVRLD